MRILVLLLLIAGLALSVYLAWRRVEIKSGQQGGADICGGYLGGSCDEALDSPLSEQLGISLSAWGLVYYGSMFCLLAMAWGLGEQFRAEAGILGLAAAATAAVLGVVLLVLMALGVAPWCPLCAGVHAVNLVLAAVWPRGAGTSWKEMRGALAAGLRFMRSGETDNLGELRWRMTALLVPPLVAATLYQWAYIEERALLPDDAFDPQKIVAAYDAAPRREIPVGADDASLGPSDAPLQLVVFSDFQCPICRKFAAVLRDLVKRRGDELQVVFKHWPLGTDCNEGLRGNLHPQACRAALAAEAAHRQGKFWCYHDALFAAPSLKQADAFETAARECGLDAEQLSATMSNEAVKAKVEADVALGRRLGVKGTPTAFLNGRSLTELRPQSIELLLDHELASK